LPKVEPIDTAIPLNSVGNISTAMQYMRLMPTLDSASNTDDRTRFSIEDVMKYNQAADTPDPKKLTTNKNLRPSLLTNSGTNRLVGIHATPMMTMFTYTD